MATRYTGTLKLTITYRGKTDDYSVRIEEIHDDARFATQSGIRLSPHDRATIAADSRKAYDRVAAAAISFAGSVDDAVYCYAATDADGEVKVTRKLGEPA